MRYNRKIKSQPTWHVPGCLVAAVVGVSMHGDHESMSHLPFGEPMSKHYESEPGGYANWLAA